MKTALRASAVAALLILAASAGPPAHGDDLADQIDSLVEGMRQALDQYRPRWKDDQREAYAKGCRDALKQYLAEPLTAEEMGILRAGQRNWARESLPPTPGVMGLKPHLDALDYIVEQMCERPHLRPTEAEQEAIDSQIDFLCDRLKAGLLEHFSKHSKEEDLAMAAESVRASLKRCSRNPWFLALKEPLDSKEENEVRDNIAQTLTRNLEDWKKRKAEGKELKFDWGVTAAWTVATKFVSKTVQAPTDRMLVFTHSPTMPGMGIQVRSPMMSSARAALGATCMRPSGSSSADVA